MARDPQPLARPLLVLGGYLDPGFAAGTLARAFRRVTGDRRIVRVNFFWRASIQSCREHVHAMLKRHLVDAGAPPGAPEAWPEVDVVGFSMGGVIARVAASELEPVPAPGPVRIARLFTLDSPHRGARMAEWPAPTLLQRELRAGSPLLRALDGREAAGRSFALHPFTRFGDRVVGPERTAPAGMRPIGVRPPRFSPSHLAACRDPRLVAEIARHLRGEPPFADPGPAHRPER